MATWLYNMEVWLKSIDQVEIVRKGDIILAAFGSHFQTVVQRNQLFFVEKD